MEGSLFFIYYMGNESMVKIFLFYRSKIKSSIVKNYNKAKRACSFIRELRVVYFYAIVHTKTIFSLYQDYDKNSKYLGIWFMYSIPRKTLGLLISKYLWLSFKMLYVGRYIKRLLRTIGWNKVENKWCNMNFTLLQWSISDNNCPQINLAHYNIILSQQSAVFKRKIRLVE